MSSLVGSPITRVDGPAKVMGRATYAAEFHPDGLIYAAIVESAISAGSISHIDSTQAERAPDVFTVLTHLNAPKLPYGPYKQRPAVEPVSGAALRVLQDAEIKFSGQPIGVVVAQTQTQAEYAASLVRVRYVPTNSLTLFDTDRSVPTSEAAAKKGRGPEARQGHDADEAFHQAAVKIDGHYVQPREHHNAMEPHATVAEWKDGQLTIWDKTQWLANGSTTTASIGPAVREACVALLAKISTTLGSSALFAPDLQDKMRSAGSSQIEAQSDSKPGDKKDLYAMYSFGAIFAEVHVDPDFGTVRVTRIFGAYDAGQIVNITRGK